MTALLPPIGILGGTFDPIHFGHLRSALEIQQLLNLREIRLIPCYQPAHRELPLATPEQRLQMVKLAIQNESNLSVDDCEIQRKNTSYTIDTLNDLEEHFPKTPICLIMGIDAFLSFTQWHRWQDILKKSHLIVTHRPHYQLPTSGVIADLLKAHMKQDESALRTSLSGNIVVRPITALEISATDIRQQIKEGKNPRYLLPDSVLDYIHQHHVYQS